LPSARCPAAPARPPLPPAPPCALRRMQGPADPRRHAVRRGSALSGAAGRSAWNTGGVPRRRVVGVQPRRERRCRRRAHGQRRRAGEARSARVGTHQLGRRGRHGRWPRGRRDEEGPQRCGRGAGDAGCVVSGGVAGAVWKVDGRGAESGRPGAARQRRRAAQGDPLRGNGRGGPGVVRGARDA